MKAIHSSDTIFITVFQRGITILSMRLSGACSLSDITRHLHNALAGTPGMVSISLRNGSQGWMHRYNMTLRPAA